MLNVQNKVAESMSPEKQPNNGAANQREVMDEFIMAAMRGQSVEKNAK